MTDRAPDPAPERLLAHEPWLGALARRLVRDADEAEDVAQETLRRALESPPEDPGALRSFLASIARHFAYDGARRRRRREARERAAAKAEPLPATWELLARLDRQRDVLDAVRELEEPFREAILLRYYEELKPRAIAKRLGIPVATVKSRLRRGQERLRAKLAARYGEAEWRAALAPLLVLPAASSATAAIPPLVALALSAVALAGTLQLAAELDAGDGELRAPAGLATPEFTRFERPSGASSHALVADPGQIERRASAPPLEPAPRRMAEAVRWPEESLLWIDLERGVLRAPLADQCQASAELLASPEAVIAALAAQTGGVLLLSRSGADAPLPTRDAALELEVRDAQGAPAHDIPVRVLWRGDGAQRVLWRGRSQQGRVFAPGLRGELARLLPRGEVLASFDFPLADVRACVLGFEALAASAEVPCLQMPPSGALRLELRDPFGGELAPGACVWLRARQPDGSTWEHALEWHAGGARFAPVALGAELEVEVRAPDLPPSLRRVPPLFDAGEELALEIVAGRPSARCSGRLVVVGGSAHLDREVLAELSDEAGQALGHWRFALEADGRFASALHAAPGVDPQRATRLRLRVGAALAEVPFAWPAPGVVVELGELALAPALELARGLVVREDGEPLLGALVRVDRLRALPGAEQRLWLPHAHARTDADGRFHIFGAAAPEERLELVLEIPEHCAERRPLDATAGSELVLIARRGGAIEGAVSLPPSVDAARIAVLVRPERGEPRLLALEPSGAFRASGLPPGPAAIELVTTSGAAPVLLRADPCCVPAGGVADLGTLGLRDRVRAIERRCLEATGPFAERELELRGESAAGAWVWRGRSDRDGRIALVVPSELAWLDALVDGERRLRFDAREAHGWVDLARRR